MTLLETRIERSRGWDFRYFDELWHYRELLFFFAWRDVKVRYKQTTLGVVWAALQPLLSLGVFTLSLSRQVNQGSEETPYVLFAYSGIVAWGYFSKALLGASHCLVGSSNLITKVYFPRVFIPAGIVLSGLADFLIALFLALPLMAAHGYWPAPMAFLTIPILVLVTMMLTLGLSLGLCALQVRYRDVGYALNFLTQLWMFATPVVYPLSFVPETVRPFCRLNPMTGLIEGFRSALLGTTWDMPALFISLVAAPVIFFLGSLMFHKMERRFADYL